MAPTAIARSLPPLSFPAARLSRAVFARASFPAGSSPQSARHPPLLRSRPSVFRPPYPAPPLPSILNPRTHFSSSPFSLAPVNPPLPPSSLPSSSPSVAVMEEPSAEQHPWEVKMLYDGDCPLCMREVNMLRSRNESHGRRILFVDIAAPEYTAEENCGISFEEAMGRIHAIERDGSILTDIAAFRRFYEAVDLGWVYAITTVKGVGAIADAIYGFWAKYRLPITGRPGLEVVLEERRRRREEAECSSGDRCRMD